MVPFWRAYKHHKNPNHRWAHEVDIALTTSRNIMSNSLQSQYLSSFPSFPTWWVFTNLPKDLIDSNPFAMDQIIWGVTHPNDVHPGVASLVSNPALVDLLLIRHFKAHGGLVLPPLHSARELQAAHEVVAQNQVASGLNWGDGRTMMVYPNWRDARIQASLVGSSAPGVRRGQSPAHCSGRGGGFEGRRGMGRGGRGGY